MGLMKWRSSSRRESTIYLGRNPADHAAAATNNNKQPKWQEFWRKFYREKKTCPAPTFQASYEPEDYLQNFDQGTGWSEPDNLPRSFSARFADPSKILPKSRSVHVVSFYQRSSAN